MISWEYQLISGFLLDILFDRFCREYWTFRWIEQLASFFLSSKAVQRVIDLNQNCSLPPVLEVIYTTRSLSTSTWSKQEQPIVLSFQAAFHEVVQGTCPSATSYDFHVAPPESELVLNFSLIFFSVAYIENIKLLEQSSGPTGITLQVRVD